MSIDITNATDVAIQKTDRLITDVVETVQCHGKIGIVTAVKGSAISPDILGGVTKFREGDFTGVNEGGVKVQDITVTNEYFTLEEKYTAEQVAKTILKLQMKPGVNPEDLVIMDVIMELKQNDVNFQYDKAVFLGSKEAVAGDRVSINTIVDGLEKKILASATTGGVDEVQKSGVAKAVFTEANIAGKVKAFIVAYNEKYPHHRGQDKTIYLQPVDYDKFRVATWGLNGVINANSLGFGDEFRYECQHPAYPDFKIFGANGKAGSYEMWATRPDNVMEVTDGDAETDFIKFFWSDRDEAFLLHMGIRLGTAIARKNEVFLQKA
jgi:hypothetical protein